MRTSPPPGPKGLPLLGNLLEFGSDVLGFFESAAARYGDVVSLRLGAWPALFINHPAHIEKVLLTENTRFIKHRFFWRHVTDIFGRGLVTNEGASWLRQRRLAQPAFHRDRIAGYAATMTDYSRDMLATWQDRPSVEIHAEMMRLTMAIVTKTLFGSELGDDEMREVNEAFDDAVDAIAVRFRRPVKIPDAIPLPSNIRYRRAVKRLDRLVFRLIEERRRNPGDDLLTMLMQARDDDGQAMDERQLRDEAVTIFLAGHETTALTLSWTFLLLARNPASEARLLEEIDGVLGGRTATAADMSRLPFATHVVEESMRLYPPAYAFGREAIAECEIDGYRVPVGTTVFISPWVIHRDPRFFPDPDAFRPERWENDFAKTLPRFTYLPFGGGPRLCVGNSFAMMEAVLILATVLQRFRLELENPDARVTPLATITLRPPKRGIPMRLLPRRKGEAAIANPIAS